MKFPSLRPRSFLLLSLLALLSSPITNLDAQTSTPTLWLIGDSTVKNGTPGLAGWGEEIGAMFDPAKIKVQNCARGGRSSRTFLTEGLWDKVAAGIKPGDFVLMQFGHNDAGKVSGELSPGRPARASLKGNGEDTEEADVGTTGKKETVHSYGWYLRKFITDTKAKGATPIVLSMVPRNDWVDGKVRRASGDFGKWAAEAAKQENVPFVDLNEIAAKHFEELGQDKVKTFFPKEHTHTSVEGATLNAKSVIEGLQGLKDVPLRNDLATGAATAPAAGAPAAQ